MTQQNLFKLSVKRWVCQPNLPNVVWNLTVCFYCQRVASRSPHVGCVRYARTRSPFSLQPQPTACVPCGTHPTDGFKGRLKKRSQRLFYLLGDKGYLKNSRRWCFGHSFSDDLQRLNPLQPAPSPVGKGWGEGIPRMAAIFPRHLNRPNTSLAACCPLSNSLPRERGRGGCWG